MGSMLGALTLLVVVVVAHRPSPSFLPLLLGPLLLLLLLGLADGEVIPVQVGRSGDDLALVFSPDNVTAQVGDFVQFQFYPLNHSVVQADFNNPCVPLDNRTGPGGFFSGFQPLPKDTRILTTFTIPVNTPDPIFFYCSQGRHCQQGFVGAINPTSDKSLAAFRAAAANAPNNISPGEQLPPAPTMAFPTARPSQFSNFTSGGETSDDSTQGVTNVGAIVGGVLGGVVFMILSVSAGMFWIMRRRDLAARRTRARDRNKVAFKGAAGVTIGKPIVQEPKEIGPPWVDRV